MPGIVKFNASEENIEDLCKLIDCQTNPPKRHDASITGSSIFIYPHDEHFEEQFNNANYGPIIIPAKGMTINLKDSLIYALYRRVINAYEGHTVVREKDNVIRIDGEIQDEYTFSMDYEGHGWTWIDMD